jgi:hypothetical protein
MIEGLIDDAETADAEDLLQLELVQPRARRQRVGSFGSG